MIRQDFGVLALWWILMILKMMLVFLMILKMMLNLDDSAGFWCFENDGRFWWLILKLVLNFEDYAGF